MGKLPSRIVDIVVLVFAPIGAKLFTVVRLSTLGAVHTSTLLASQVCQVASSNFEPLSVSHTAQGEFYKRKNPSLDGF
jgi:hypothetical protein